MRSVLGVVLAAQLFAAPAYAGDNVKVHLDSNFGAAGIEPVDLGAARCLAPCDQPFPREGMYRITGEGLIPSDAFYLPARSNEVTLDVDAGMQAQKTTGAVMGIGGIILSCLGVGYSLASLASRIDGPPASTTERAITIGTIFGGLASTAVGTLLYFTAGTRVRVKHPPLRVAP
jgi:hypothetical protein